MAWLGGPDVRRWYDAGELAPATTAGTYGPVIEGSEPTRGFVILIDDAPAGSSRACVLGDQPDYQRQVDVPPRLSRWTSASAR